jgi:acetyltransferase
MTTIERLDAKQAEKYLPDLVALLTDCVESGAAVGFMPPLSEAEARDYWQHVADDIAAGTRILVAALQEDQVVGSVQLELAQKSNGLHRAEVQKLMVHRRCRGQGIAGQLMTAIEHAGSEANRTLLVLDTRRGDTADRSVYRRLGWTEAGVIPQFAMSADGTMHDTVIFYKLI